MDVDNVNDADLYDSFKNFVEKAVSTLGGISGIDPPTLISQEDVYVKDSRFMGTHTVIIPDYSSFIDQHIGDIEKLIEYQSLVQKLKDHPSVREHYHGRFFDSENTVVENLDLAPLVKSDFINNFLRKYIKEQSSFEFDEERFSNLYATMRGFIDRKVGLDYYYSPLHNFDSKEDVIEFTDNLRIKKLVGEEMENFLRRVFRNPFGLLPLIEVMGKDIFVIETIVGRQKNETIDGKNARTAFSTTVSILRLYKRGNFGFNVVYMTDFYSWDPSVFSSMPIHARSRFFGSTWVVSSDEIVQLKDFWDLCSSLLQQAASFKFIKTALKRFNLALEEVESEDKLIDLIIALESLYLTERDELSYRLSLRISLLLQNDFEDVNYLRKFVKKAYDLRSNIIHGSEKSQIVIDENVITLEEVVSNLEDIVRKSIKRFIALGSRSHTHEDIVSRIDQAILDKDIRKTLIEDSQDLMI